MTSSQLTAWEFEKELTDVGLQSFGMETATTALWRTPKGYFISVPVLPDGQLYPDYLVGKALRQMNLVDGNTHSTSE